MNPAPHYVQMLALLLVASVAVVSSFPSGAPLSACGHLMPIHEDAEAQETPPPYIILLSDTNYTAHQPITVTVTSADQFLAFMFQGRTKSNQPVGHFADTPPVTKFLSCYGDNDTLSHAAAFGRKSMQFTWYPPEGDVGDIYIRGSIAQTKYIFWAVESEAIEGREQKVESGADRLPSSTCTTATVLSLVFVCGLQFFNLWH